MLIRMTIEFEVDDTWYDDEKGKNWFFNEVLADLSLFSKEVGDMVAEKITVRKVEGWTP